MCGIVGFMGQPIQGIDHCKSSINKMSEKLFSRGPDDAGEWVENDGSIALGHRRLAILDLTKNGKQPMISPSGRYVMVFNGEIYNHLEIRKQMGSQGFKWKGNSDTETLLTSIEYKGVERTIANLVGMFALAVWDKRLKKLYLIRDRMGEKPLYYGWQGEGRKKFFVFGSCLKSILEHPSFVAEIDQNSLSSYLRFGYVPTPKSIFKGIKKLEPGTIISISFQDMSFSECTYWNFIEISNRKKNLLSDKTLEEHAVSLKRLLENTIRGQMISDVPVGAFLSGGIDSSTIVAIMQRISSKPIKTFSIGFEDPSFNEANHSREIAKFLGTNHTEMIFEPSTAMDMIGMISEAYDEPFSDSSQIPTLLVSELSKKDVKVVLTGDGADEIFCGYNRYLFGNKVWGKVAPYPSFLKSLISKAIHTLPKPYWSFFLQSIPGLHSHYDWGSYLYKGAKVLDSENILDLYSSLVSTWKEPNSVLLSKQKSIDEIKSLSSKFVNLNSIEKLMAVDCKTYLMDDILVKVDRASMNFGLEARVPFLDHRIVEYAWQLPLKMKLGNQTKLILRQILKEEVPLKLFERPKMGFGVPIGDWLRGPLKDWASDLLSPEKLKKDGFFDADTISKFWDEHKSGSVDRFSQIWNILVFQMWKEKYC